MKVSEIKVIQDKKVYMRCTVRDVSKQVEDGIKRKLKVSQRSIEKNSIFESFPVTIQLKNETTVLFFPRQ